MITDQPCITIIAPCYNESYVVVRFLEKLEKTLAILQYTFIVIVVNDCSTDDTLCQLNDFSFNNSTLTLNVIELPENAGHQAAIYKGLLHVRTLPCDHFIIMDSDGQDDPEVIAALLQLKEADIVHVVRGKRLESLFFRGGYWLYKKAFLLLTGKHMNFGNFCLISRKVLEAAIASRFKHLPAFLAKQDVEKQYVLAARGKRMGGSSKMGFFKLCNHAKMSFIEYWDGKKLSRLLPVILLFLSMACQSRINPKTYQATNTDSLVIAPFALSLFHYQFSLAFGYGNKYLITDRFIEVRFHGEADTSSNDTLLYRQMLKPSVQLKILSKLNLDSLDTFNHLFNPNIIDGDQIFFVYDRNHIAKTIWIQNRFNTELSKAIELIDQIVPEPYKIKYDQEMFKAME